MIEHRPFLWYNEVNLPDLIKSEPIHLVNLGLTLLDPDEILTQMSINHNFLINLSTNINKLSFVCTWKMASNFYPDLEVVIFCKLI